MMDLQGNSITEIRRTLLDINIPKLNRNTDEAANVQKSLVSCFHSLYEPLSSTSVSGRGDDSLLLLDTFSLWLSRSSKLITDRKCDKVFVGTLEDDLFTMENNVTLFRCIIDLMGGSSGPLKNALDDLLTKLLRLIKLIYLPEQYIHFLDQLLCEILQIPSTLRICYTLVHTLAQDIDMFKIFDIEPEFVNNALSLIAQESLSNSIGKCLTRVMVNIFMTHFESKTGAIDEWMEIWSRPALTYLEQDKYRKQVTSYFLVPLFQDMPPDAFRRFMSQTNFTDKPGLFIPILKTAQNLSMEEMLFADSGSMTLDIINELLGNDTFKLAVFEVLTFSSQKSRPIPDIIFDMIKENLMVFFVETEIKSRNQFASLFNAFIRRIRDSGYAIDKKLGSLKKANKFPQEQRDLTKTLSRYENFLEWLFAFLKTQMVPGIWHPRITLAFSILRTLIETGLNHSVTGTPATEGKLVSFPFSLDIVSDKCLFRLLVDNLSNDVPTIRQEATSFLHIIFNSKGTEHLFKGCLQKHLDEVSARYMEKYQSSNIGASIRAFSFFISSDKSTVINKELMALETEVAKVRGDPVSNLKK